MTDSNVANRPWLFAIKFKDGTVAICRGKKVIKVVRQGERPEGWEALAFHPKDKSFVNTH